ncbi:MAG: tRNA (adenosine(37)-N6)-threonylcarbamoyltransferase complex ATPase subunit type 1 TsaE [Coxiella endosymbiont of Dermacentor nuttalli]
MIIPFASKIISTEKAMLSLGEEIANYCSERAIIYLLGELGAGKTTLVRGFLRGLGYTGFVKSPTYTLIETYELSTIEVIHIDLYRLTESEDYLNLGLSDYLKNNSILLIEWPKEFIFPPTLRIKIDIQDKKRIVNFTN